MDESAARKTSCLDRMFTHESLALAQARGNDDFRLLVDRALSEFYDSAEFRDLYAKWFGAFDGDARVLPLGHAAPR